MKLFIAKSQPKIEKNSIQKRKPIEKALNERDEKYSRIILKDIKWKIM